MNDLTKNILLWVVIVFVLLLGVQPLHARRAASPRRSRYSTFLDDVKASRVDSVVLQGEMIYGELQGQDRTSRPATPRPTTPP